MTQPDWLNATLSALMQMSGWEVAAALLGIGYILFAGRESQWCWPMAFISTCIYSVLFWEQQLPMQSALNVYYIGMAVYGFVIWHRHEQQTQTLVIHRWPCHYHVIYLLVGALLSGLAGLYLSAYDTQYPYLDAAVMVFSVMNTVLMARKVLENWLYWQFINSAAIVLYFMTGFYATIVMFSIYLLLAVHGYLNWHRLLREQAA